MTLREQGDLRMDIVAGSQSRFLVHQVVFIAAANEPPDPLGLHVLEIQFAPEQADRQGPVILYGDRVRIIAQLGNVDRQVRAVVEKPVEHGRGRV